MGTSTPERRSLLRSRTSIVEESSNTFVESNNRTLQAADTVSKEFDIPFEVLANSADDSTAATDSDSYSWNGSDAGSGGSQSVSIIIILLVLFNIVTLLVLMFQHNVFKRTWFYLE